MGGTGQPIRCEVLASAADVTATCHAAHDEEYGKILDRYGILSAEIDKDTAAKHFAYAELEENDEDLLSVAAGFGKASARGALGVTCWKR